MQWDDGRVSRTDRAVFRLPGVSLVIPFLFFVCVTPLANAGPKFWLALYVLPVLGLAYILLTRTVADSELIRTAGLFGGRRLRWADLDGLEFHGPRWAIAVGTDGRRVRLPMVRPRDLPQLARVSGGRLLLGREAPTDEDGGIDPAADTTVAVTPPADPLTDVTEPATAPGTDPVTVTDQPTGSVRADE